MQDMQTYFRKLRRDAVDCALISKRATDAEKEQLFGQLAEHLALLVAELEHAIETKGRVPACQDEAQAALIALLRAPAFTRSATGIISG